MVVKDNVSQKEIYIWNIVGSILSAFSSVVLLMLVNRILSIEDSDIFSIAFSISQLMATIGTFKVRVFQATDVNKQFSFNDYFILRIITVFFMLLFSMIYTAQNNYGLSKYIIVFLLCVYRAIDCFSDVFEGYFQQKDRLDLAGKAISIKVVIPTIFFGISMLLTKNLLISVFVFVTSDFFLLYVFNYLVYKILLGKTYEDKINLKKFSLKKIGLLFFKCLPLFINSYLIMDIFNMPKLIIDMNIAKGLLENGSQTYYNILFMPASVMTLVIIVFRPLFTTMANYKLQNQIKKIIKIIATIIACILLVTVLCIGCAWVLGIPVLSIVYGTGEALYSYKMVLIIILIGGMFNSIAYVLDDTITIFRTHKYLMVSYIVTWIFAKMMTTIFITNYGLLGASLSYCFSMAILMVCNLVILIASMIIYKSNLNKN